MPRRERLRHGRGAAPPPLRSGRAPVPPRPSPRRRSKAASICSSVGSSYSAQAITPDVYHSKSSESATAGTMSGLARNTSTCSRGLSGRVPLPEEVVGRVPRRTSPVRQDRVRAGLVLQRSAPELRKVQGSVSRGLSQSVVLDRCPPTAPSPYPLEHLDKANRPAPASPCLS